MSAIFFPPTKQPTAPVLDWNGYRKPHLRDSELLFVSMSPNSDLATGYFAGGTPTGSAATGSNQQVNLSGATSTYLGIIAQTAVGTITLTGTGTVNYQWGSSYNQQLGTFSYSPTLTASALQTILQAIPTMPTILVTGPAGGPYTYSFPGSTSIYSNALILSAGSGTTATNTTVQPTTLAPLVAGSSDSVTVTFYDEVNLNSYGHNSLESEIITFSAAQLNQLTSQPAMNGYPTAGLFVPLVNPHGECSVVLSSTAGFGFVNGMRLGLIARGVYS